MIELNDRLNDRWVVKSPFARGNGRNFLFYFVEDDQLQQRPALLKTVRKTDLPVESLYEWRCRALRAEQERLATLMNPSMPEPLDAFTLPTGEPALVYTLIGEAPGNYLLREKLQLWGFLQRRCRQIDKVAQVMFDLARFTEELWRAGYVHANLNPDHIYSLRDGVLRVTGQTAVCRRDGNTIRADEPGLRNLTIGYQGYPHHQVAAGLSPEPLDAVRVRWNSYAALALDLIWGRDVRDYCAGTGNPSVVLTPDTDNHFRRDFNAFGEHAFTTRGALALREPLSKLHGLIRECLNWRMELRPTVYQDFLKWWDFLDRSDFGRLMEVNEGEMAFREKKGWNVNFYKRDQTPSFDGEESEFLVCDYEETQERETADGKKQRRGRYQVINVAHPPRRRMESRRPLHLSTLPFLRNYFLPGDIVPGVVKHLPAGGVRVEPADWLKRDQRSRPEDGQKMRALSLGRRWASFDPNVPLPLALVEIEGALCTYRVRQYPGQRWTIFPRPGRFFNAEFLEDEDGFGVIPDLPPDPSCLAGKQFFAEVREVVMGGVFFDLPVADDYFISCRLPLDRCPRQEVRAGEKVPICVDRVEGGSILTRWDQRLAGEKAAVGARYPGAFARLKAGDSLIEVRFGERRQFGGVVEARNPAFPWGTPYRAWQEGRPLNVEVVGERDEGTRTAYRLHFLDDRAAPRRVEDVFRPGQALKGKVLACSEARGVYVLLTEGTDEDVVQVDGLIPHMTLLRKEQQDLRGAYPQGADVAVKVTEVDPAKRQVLLKREW